MNSEGAVDPSVGIKWSKKCRSSCKNIDDQVSLGKPKTVEYKKALQALWADPEIISRRV